MKRRRGTILEWIVLFIIGLAGILYFNIKEKKGNERIMSNTQYAVGEVLKYDPGNSQSIPGYSTARSPFVEYNYKVEEQIITNFNTRSSTNLPDEGVVAGQRYLVVYNADKPEESRILFDKPIHDSADFDRYVEELKENVEN